MLGIAAAAVTVLATGLVLWQLRARQILDHPNERSSHDRAVPRGGGIAVMATLTVGWCLLTWWQGESPEMAIIALLAIALAGFSFLDDLKGLPAVSRLVLQALTVAVGCTLLPQEPVFQGIFPPIADQVATWFCWLWFINLFNFMDGVDGISAVEASCIGIGIALITAGNGPGAHLAASAAIAAGAAIGFGIWNWHPAKIFLGDVGSVGLGFVLGWLLLSLAASGQWLPALILPLYYLSDATWTLLRRLLRGEKFWQAHRCHFYQYAVRQSGNHGLIALLVLCCNLVLITATVWAALWDGGWLALVLASVAVLLLLYNFATMKTPESSSEKEPDGLDGS